MAAKPLSRCLNVQAPKTLQQKLKTQPQQTQHYAAEEGQCVETQGTFVVVIWLTKSNRSADIQLPCRVWKLQLDNPRMTVFLRTNKHRCLTGKICCRITMCTECWGPDAGHHILFTYNPYLIHYIIFIYSVIIKYF